MSSKFDLISSTAVRLVLAFLFLAAGGWLGVVTWTWVWQMTATFGVFSAADVALDLWLAGNSKLAVKLRARIEARKAARGVGR